MLKSQQLKLIDEQIAALQLLRLAIAAETVSSAFKCEADKIVGANCLEDQIAQINSLSPEELRFSHLRDLKSGRDKYSSLTLFELGAQLGELSAQYKEQLLRLEPQWQAVACRWHLRGLRMDLALKKAETDREVTINCDQAQARKKAK